MRNNLYTEFIEDFLKANLPKDSNVAMLYGSKDLQIISTIISNDMLYHIDLTIIKEEQNYDFSCKILTSNLDSENITTMHEGFKGEMSLYDTLMYSINWIREKEKTQVFFNTENENIDMLDFLKQQQTLFIILPEIKNQN